MVVWGDVLANLRHDGKQCISWVAAKVCDTGCTLWAGGGEKRIHGSTNGGKNIVPVRHSVRRGVEDRRGKIFGRSQLFHVMVCLRGKPVIYCPLDREPGSAEENGAVHFVLPLTATHQVEFRVT